MAPSSTPEIGKAAARPIPAAMLPYTTGWITWADRLASMRSPTAVPRSSPSEPARSRTVIGGLAPSPEPIMAAPTTRKTRLADSGVIATPAMAVQVDQTSGLTGPNRRIRAGSTSRTASEEIPIVDSSSPMTPTDTPCRSRKIE